MVDRVEYAHDVEEPDRADVHSLAHAPVIGRCQSVANEVDAAAAAAMGVQVVRRLTGGGAMFLQPHGAITYSLYLPESAVTGLSIRQSYEVCEAWVVRGLRSLGVDAHHVPINDIACSEGKIGGGAGTALVAERRGGVVGSSAAGSGPP